MSDDAVSPEQVATAITETLADVLAQVPQADGVEFMHNVMLPQLAGLMYSRFGPHMAQALVDTMRERINEAVLRDVPPVGGMH